MFYRRLLVQATNALLCLGPLLAGLAGFGPLFLSPFVVLFMLWQVQRRPGSWPGTSSEWLSPVALPAVLTLIVSQLVLVTLLFVAGRAMGGVLGVEPVLHPLAPLALSLLALPLLRLQGEEAELLDDEDQILWRRGVALRAVPVSAERAVSELFALAEAPEVRTEALLDPLDHLLDSGDIWSRLAVLSAVLDASPADQHIALRRAMILKATDQGGEADFTVPGEMRAAFAAAGTSPDLLALLAMRGKVLLQKTPVAVLYFPPRGVVLDLAAHCGDSPAARALRELARALMLAEPPAPMPARTMPSRGELRSFTTETSGSAQRA